MERTHDRLLTKSGSCGRMKLKEGNLMASVFDVATYILEKLGTLSTMKLQKLCYYCQAWSLVWDDAPLFDEEFQAWANGPVCVELFQKTKGRFSVDAEDEGGNSSALTENQKDSIDIVLKDYGQRDAQWLSRLSHLEDPWKIARNDEPDGWKGENIITKESMAIYYGGL